MTVAFKRSHDQPTGVYLRDGADYITWDKVPEEMLIYDDLMSDPLIGRWLSFHGFEPRDWTGAHVRRWVR